MARTYTNTPEPRYVEKAKETESIPQVSSDDNGKYLGVVDGKIQATSIPAVPVAEAVADATDADDVVQTVNAVIASLVNAGLMAEYVPPVISVIINFEAKNAQTSEPLEPIGYSQMYNTGDIIPSSDVTDFISAVLEQNPGFTFVQWSDDPTNYEVTKEDGGKTFTAVFTAS